MKNLDIIKTKSVFCGRLLNLYLETRCFPNGNVVRLEVIKHPGAVLIVPFLSRDKVILIRQYRPVINSYVWELPAGTFNLKEKPLQCAKRELTEEIGYVAKVLKRVGYIYPSPGYTTEKIIIYEAHRLKKVATKSEEDEIITPRVFSKKELKKLLQAGRIVDAKTICALKIAKII